MKTFKMHPIVLKCADNNEKKKKKLASCNQTFEILAVVPEMKGELQNIKTSTIMIASLYGSLKIEWLLSKLYTEMTDDLSIFLNQSRLGIP